LHHGRTDGGWWSIWHSHADNSPTRHLFQHCVPARGRPFYVQKPEGRGQIAEHASDDPFDIVLFHALTRPFTHTGPPYCSGALTLIEDGLEVLAHIKSETLASGLWQA
jgi:hypothetical protein